MANSKKSNAVKSTKAATSSNSAQNQTPKVKGVKSNSRKKLISPGKIVEQKPDFFPKKLKVQEQMLLKGGAKISQITVDRKNNQVFAIIEGVKLSYDTEKKGYHRCECCNTRYATLVEAFNMLPKKKIIMTKKV